MLSELAWGRDARRVAPLEPERSVGSQETFGRDTDNPETWCGASCSGWPTSTARRMRKQRMLGRTVTISVRFADFAELTRLLHHANPTDVADEIYAQA